jgi:hypothetical protein
LKPPVVASVLIALIKVSSFAGTVASQLAIGGHGLQVPLWLSAAQVAHHH